MNKKELIIALSEKTKQTQKSCDIFLKELTTLIMDNTKEGKTTWVGDLGRFGYRTIKAHKKYSPIYKSVFFVPQKVIPNFKASMCFKKSIV